MSLRPEPRERDEIEFNSELGWLAALSVAIVSLAFFAI